MEIISIHRVFFFLQSLQNVVYILDLQHISLWIGSAAFQVLSSYMWPVASKFDDSDLKVCKVG